jgi:NAD(P)-dependent dehydrogenase (short-subunit alcohol dehydrogenase family)
MKKVFITGGSRGIGRGIASVFAENGYDVAFTYHSAEDEARSLCAEIESHGVRAFMFQAAMEERGVAEKVTAEAIEALGGIDALICNAGRTVHNHILNTDENTCDYVYNLNYRSYLMCTKVAARRMVDDGTAGSIVYITSTRSIRAYPEDCLYGGMKAALNRSAESMAIDLARYRIRVNCIAPGNTAIRGNFTPEELSRSAFQKRIPLGRSGTPREVGMLALYLCSDAAAYITGDIIKIDGGLILPGMPER